MKHQRNVIMNVPKLVIVGILHGLEKSVHQLLLVTFLIELQHRENHTHIHIMQFKHNIFRFMIVRLVSILNRSGP